MAMVWKNRNDRFNPSGGNDRDSFEEHSKRMSMFRNSHARVLEGNALLLKNMRSFHVTRILAETGGSAGLITARGWFNLIPMSEVTPRRFSKN